MIASCQANPDLHQPHFTTARSSLSSTGTGNGVCQPAAAVGFNVGQMDSSSYSCHNIDCKEIPLVAY